MFLAFGGIVAIEEAGGDIDVWSAMMTLTVFMVLMSLGVWHVFRKRGRIYI
jgi:predicted permease